MADEKKKKGFWSWLGFGKKDEQPEEKVENTEVQLEEQQKAEQPSEVIENVQSIEEEKLEEQTKDSVETFVSQERSEPEVRLEVEQAVEAEPEFAKNEGDQTACVLSESVEATQDKEVVDVAEVKLEVQDLVDAESPEDKAEIEQQTEQQVSETDVLEESHQVVESYQEKPASEGGFFSRLIKGLIKTKENIGSGFRNFFRGKKIDDELFEELEEQLLIADLGVPTTTKIINNLTQHATKQQLRDAELLYQQLKVELAEVLKPVAQPLEITAKKPYVILMVGVNGVGKTTTIGKLARKFQQEGKSVMLAAGDTFRAAAVEQLQVWGERNNIPVVAQATGADSASVIFDAMQSAAAKGIDVLIADTAGRLQNKNNLMDELKKIVRVMKKYDETAPHEIMLTLDAGTGQNAISQAKLFNEAVGLTGITLTKLDGTAKGGVIFAIADQFNIPIRFIGVGEKIEDLRPFNADEFIEALFSNEDEKE